MRARVDLSGMGRGGRLCTTLRFAVSQFILAKHALGEAFLRQPILYSLLDYFSIIATYRKSLRAAQCETVVFRL
jgi:hypothetical protein